MNKKSLSAKKLFDNPVVGPYIALIALCVIASIAAPEIFPTGTNIANILRQVSIVGVVSIGMTIVLLVGGIDLSVTSVMALSACLMAHMSEDLMKANKPEMVMWVVLMILGIGLLIGLVNGVMIVFRNVEPFIITLGMMQVLKGINYIYTQGAPGGTVTEFWKMFGSESLFDAIPYPVILFAALMIIFGIVLHKTIYGRHLYAIGSNKEAARLSGIKVNKNKIIAYMLCGLTAAIAGIMLCARVRVGEPNGSNGYDMDSIAAVVIGGTSMAGGTGTLFGTLAGVLIMAVMNNMLNILGADPYLQIVIKGLIVLVAVLIQKKR
ncbi:MAG: ABC transporter permease [Christensenella sp.]|uniref:ABC transporter permease n=1 Tax=Christensenella sp. TaxID=1935934 RepID=UPI002B2136B0|nr:ABC transporter permease [Christensenella sp.]MEA5002586.1 ABC transporter permease [Christensenella sp.]